MATYYQTFILLVVGLSAVQSRSFLWDSFGKPSASQESRTSPVLTTAVVGSTTSGDNELLTTEISSIEFSTGTGPSFNVTSDHSKYLSYRNSSIVFSTVTSPSFNVTSDHSEHPSSRNSSIVFSTVTSPSSNVTS